MRNIGLIVLLSFGVVFYAFTEDVKKEKAINENKPIEVLSSIVGDWKGKGEVKPCTWAPKGKKYSQGFVCKNILDGSHIEVDGAYTMDGETLHSKNIYSYDKDKDGFKLRYFYSNGNVLTYTGKYDDKQKIVVFNMDGLPKNKTYIMTMDISNKDVITYTSVGTEDGKVFYEAELVMKRTKEKSVK